MDRDHGRRLEAGAAAVLSADYQQAVQLLLRLVPTVFSTDAFALKGGTAINLFLSPVSRLSVDLDLVFLPLGLSRGEALAAIDSELDGVRERAAATGLVVRAPGRLTGEDTLLLVSDGLTEVKKPPSSGNCTTWKCSGAVAPQTSSARTTNSRHSFQCAVDD